MNNKLHFSTGKDDYESPDDLFTLYNSTYHFTLDAAANESNHKVDRWFGPGGEHEDALEEGLSWVPGNVWLNPPYSRGLQSKFIIKAACEGLKHLGSIVCLLPARTDTKSFHDVCMRYGMVELLKGRLKFKLNGKYILDKKGKPISAPFPSMIVVFE